VSPGDDDVEVEVEVENYEAKWRAGDADHIPPAYLVI
jgi:hypothetical protein